MRRCIVCGAPGATCTYHPPAVPTEEATVPMRRVETVINGMRTTINVREDESSVKRRAVAANKALPAPEPVVPAAPTGDVDVAGYHVGGGWYELPDGAKIRGEDAARAHLAGS